MEFLSRLLLLADDVGVDPAAKEGGGAGGAATLMAYVPLILVVVLFYVMIIAPQRRQQRSHEDMVDQLKKDDEILTRGGIFGRVVSVGKDGRIVLRVDENARLTIHKNAVAQVLTGDDSKQVDS